MTKKKDIDARYEKDHTVLLRRLALGLVVGYIAMVILFYFLAGEQLHLRQSRDNFPLGRASPQALRRLYLSTRSGIESNVALLVEQAMDRMIEQEQFSVGWDES